MGDMILFICELFPEAPTFYGGEFLAQMSVFPIAGKALNSALSAAILEHAWRLAFPAYAATAPIL